MTYEDAHNVADKTHSVTREYDALNLEGRAAVAQAALDGGSIQEMRKVARQQLGMEKP